MASAYSASLRYQPRPAPETGPSTPAFTPAPIPTPNIPEAPQTGVENIATAGQRSYLQGLLDPKSATYLGNKIRPDLTLAGSQLQQGLEGFGDYNFQTDPNGLVTAQKDNAGQPGQRYKQAYGDARSQANAAGMLYSRTAQQAVGEAWQRLTEAERGVFNQYAGQVNGILSGLASDFTNVTNSLYSLYGADVEYALANPVLTDPAAPADTGTQPQSLTTPHWGVEARRWKGDNKPKVETLSKAWGIPASQIRVTQSGTGKWVATEKQT